MDIIKERQRIWAKRNEVKMRDGDEYHTYDENCNLFRSLPEKTREAFDKANGGELKGDPKPMTALYSSSALCVNVFQYFEKNLNNHNFALELLKACNLIDKKRYNGKITAFEFECTKYPIKGENKKIISKPNIDVVIEIESKRGQKQIFAIESKFTEPYGSIDNFLKDDYYKNENKNIWENLGKLFDILNIEQTDEETHKVKRAGKEVSETGKFILKNYRYLHALQLIKHVMGIMCSEEWENQKKNVTLVYIWYDTLGEDGFNHRNEIEKFKKLIEDNTPIKFRHITYQELICNLLNQLPYNEHKDYLDYISERYL